MHHSSCVLLNKLKFMRGTVWKSGKMLIGTVQFEEEEECCESCHAGAGVQIRPDAAHGTQL